MICWCHACCRCCRCCRSCLGFQVTWKISEKKLRTINQFNKDNYYWLLHIWKHQRETKKISENIIHYGIPHSEWRSLFMSCIFLWSSVFHRILMYAPLVIEQLDHSVGRISATVTRKLFWRIAMFVVYVALQSLHSDHFIANWAICFWESHQLVRSFIFFGLVRRFI